MGEDVGDEVGDEVGDGVGVADELADGVGVGVGVGETAHTALLTMFVSNVTAPDCASTLPSMLAPVVTVMDACAMMVPLKIELVPSVAELPICQKTLHAWAPLMRLTELDEDVVSAVPTWKTNTALVLPWALSVKVPVSPTEEAEL
jgi:hypothetical protein